MSTAQVDTSSLAERPLVVDSANQGYALTRLMIPNIPTEVVNSIASVTVNAAGSAYTSIPTISFTGGGGLNAAATADMKALTDTVVTPQSGSGSYAPSDSLTITGGTGTSTILTVTHTKVVSATIAAGGTGGTSGTQTVTGTTGTGTKFQASVTVAGGAITAVLSITVAGDYTVNPTSLTVEPVTGASLTGAQLNVKMGVLTATVGTAGSYSVLPANPVSATGGSGTGATFNLTYGVSSVVVTNGGEDYVTPPTVSFTGGGGTGATGTAVVGSGADVPLFVVLPFSDELPTNDYAVNVCASQACVASYSNKSTMGIVVTLTPLSGGTLGAGTMDVVIDHAAA
jgi:hypothetical protein